VSLSCTGYLGSLCWQLHTLLSMIRLHPPWISSVVSSISLSAYLYDDYAIFWELQCPRKCINQDRHYLMRNRKEKIDIIFSQVKRLWSTWTQDFGPNVCFQPTFCRRFSPFSWFHFHNLKATPHVLRSPLHFVLMLKCLSLLLFLSFLFAKFNKKHLSPHSSPT
jgi:hypothetical protein